MVTRFATITASVFLAFALAFDQSAAADEKADAGFHDAMVEFLTIQNAATEIAGQMTYAIAQQTLVSIASSGAEITQKMQDIILDVARSTVGERFGDVDFLATLYAPLYAENYSETELRELIAFWQSPIGKKTIEVMPKLTEGSSRVLQESALEFMPGYEVVVDQRLLEAGIVPASAPAAE